MSWYYNADTGSVFELNGAQAASENQIIANQVTAAKGGAHIPAVPQRLFGPFGTQAEAQAYKDAHPGLIQQALNAVPNPVGDVASEIRADLVRLLEAAAGIVLLAIALNAIIKETTGVNPAKEAVGAAKAVRGG